jgi:hypothetical protein
MLRDVMSPKKPTTILLDSAVDLLFEIYLLRGDCSVAAKALISQRRVDELAVEECARLDDTLARTYKALQKTIGQIRTSRSRRQKPTHET